MEGGASSQGMFPLQFFHKIKEIFVYYIYSKYRPPLPPPQTCVVLDLRVQGIQGLIGHRDQTEVEMMALRAMCCEVVMNYFT